MPTDPYDRGFATTFLVARDGRVVLALAYLDGGV
jgi:hypothetical protein